MDIINEIKKILDENSALIKDNTRLTEENTFLKEIYEKLKDQERLYVSALQEIKAIVCGNYEIIDPQGRKDILKLITKAEGK